MCGVINDEANGYLFDFTRTSDHIYETYGLIEDIKNGCVESGKYCGTEKILRSNIVVVFANFLPNMSTLSLDRWNFFHTRLGSICISCTNYNSSKEYKCSVAKENSCTVTDGKLKTTVCRSDSEFITEFLECFDFEFNLRMLCDNRLAFPNISADQSSKIKKYIRKRKILTLKHFLQSNNCLKDSILPSDFIVKCSIFNNCNDLLNETCESSGSDSE